MAYIESVCGGVSEFELLNYIDEEVPEFFTSIDKKSLFQKHFKLFHELYLAEKALQIEDKKIKISALKIEITQLDSGDSLAVGFNDPLREFYLDANNLYLSNSEIQAMQNIFWQKYLALDKKAEALKTLGLSEAQHINKSALKKRFNQLAAKHHPDKGGDGEKFIQIKNAYQELMLLLD